MNFSPRRRKKRTRAFDMTPMVDVVLQLIIFFMFTMNISQLTRSKLDLPEEPGVRVETREELPFVVDVNEKGKLVVESQEVSWERLFSMVRAEVAHSHEEGKKVELLVRADRKAPTAVLNRLARHLRQEGIKGWRIGTIHPRGGL